MSPHVTWARGGHGTLVALEDDRVTVRSTIPSAPGSRPEGALASGTRFRMKVARCRREEEIFVLEGRLLDATRDARTEMAALVAARRLDDADSAGPPE
jgi:hypothetical protein